jgi:hypothetical protein
LNHGREPKLPIQSKLMKEFSKFSDPSNDNVITPALAAAPEIVKKSKENIEAYQDATKAKQDKTRHIASFGVGDLVTRVKHVPENKLDQRMWGPYQVVGIADDRKANIKIQNPHVGKDSEETHHITELLAYKGELKKPRNLIPSDELDEKSLSPKQSKLLKYAKANTAKPWSLINLIGRRVKVLWTQQHVKGYLNGTVVDYEPALGKYWVKYDKKDFDGTEHYPEALLGPKPPTWEFIDTIGDQSRRRGWCCKESRS